MTRHSTKVARQFTVFPSKGARSILSDTIAYTLSLASGLDTDRLLKALHIHDD